MVEHAAIAEVNQQRRIAVADDVDVAGVGPGEEVRVARGSGCLKPLGAAASGKVSASNSVATRARPIGFGGSVFIWFGI